MVDVRLHSSPGDSPKGDFLNVRIGRTIASGKVSSRDPRGGARLEATPHVNRRYRVLFAWGGNTPTYDFRALLGVIHFPQPLFLS